MTTLTQARKSLLALINTLPPKSTYADHVAVVADYLDNQVPLNIENANLREQLHHYSADIVNAHNTRRFTGIKDD